MSAAVAALLLSPVLAVAGDSREKAEFLYRSAIERFERGTVDDRRAAMEHLREAVSLNPREPRYLLALGRTNDRMGYYSEARRYYEDARELAPNDPQALTCIGLSWKREWLHHFESAALDSALIACTEVTRLRPYSSDAWLALVPLRSERGDAQGAFEAAERAAALSPRRPGPLLARACMDVNMGNNQRADTTFAAALPRLDPTLRGFIEDFSPIADPAIAANIRVLPDSLQPSAVARFWARLDPDPTSRENEALLEYRARAVYAWLLFSDPITGALDTRAQIYKRYGPPDAMIHNPMGERLEYTHNRNYLGAGGMAFNWQTRNQSLASYSMNALVWHYPEVGMRILLNDRSLTGFWDYPIQLDFDPQTAPRKDMVARQGDLMTTGDGRGLFHTLPPRERRLDVQGAIARFQSDRGPRMLVQVGVPGGPAERLESSWVVLDSTGTEVARGAAEVELSACDPAETRIASFATDVPPGDYQVALSVTDARARKGLYKSRASLAPTPSGLALSDVVLSCAGVTTTLEPENPRIEIDASGRVRGIEPLVVYFEIYGLVPEASGQARFEYDVRVRPLVDRRGWWQRAFGGSVPPPVVQVRREESNVGALRRQFVTVPARELAPGHYRLEIDVRDQVSGATVTGTAEFVAD